MWVTNMKGTLTAVLLVLPGRLGRSGCSSVKLAAWQPSQRGAENRDPSRLPNKPAPLLTVPVNFTHLPAPHRVPEKHCILKNNEKQCVKRSAKQLENNASCGILYMAEQDHFAFFLKSLCILMMLTKIGWSSLITLAFANNLH